MEQSEKINDHPILLFDGVCNLCNSFVQFVIRNDPEGIFRFTPLQSEVGQQLSAQGGFPTTEYSTVILYQNGKFYTHSDVALEIVRQLPGWWSLLYGLSIIPKSLRDAIYNWIANNRYRWFGKRDSCMIPTPDVKRRFL